MLRQKIFLLFLFFIIATGHTNSKAAVISNAVKPVYYFSGRTDYLNQIEKYFTNGEEFVSLVGISGIGKTELARKYAELKKDKYDVIWFFDMTEDLRIQFQNFAREINDKIGKGERKVVSEEIDTCVTSVLSYIKSKNNCLFVIDNLNINENGKAFDILQDGCNADIIISSQDKHGLRNIINLDFLKAEETKKLIKNINKNMNQQDSSFVERACHGYPLLLAQYSYFQKDNGGTLLGSSPLSQECGIYDFVQNVFKTLSIKEQHLLIRASILGTNLIDKKLLLGTEQEINTYNIIRLNLLSIKKARGTQSETFGMHSLIRKGIFKIANEEIIKKVIIEFINSLEHIIPTDSIQYKAFIDHTHNCFSGLENVVKYANKYKIGVENILILNEILARLYSHNSDHNQVIKLYKWFNENKELLNKSILTPTQKGCYISFLSIQGLYDFFFFGKAKSTLDNYEEGMRIIRKAEIPEYQMLRFRLNFIQFLCKNGRIKEAKNLINELSLQLNNANKKLINPNLLNFLFAIIYLELQKSTLAEKYINKAIQISKHSPYYPMAGNIKLDILIRSKKYKEAYILAKELKHHNENHLSPNQRELNETYIHTAAAEVGLNKLEQAKITIKKTKDYFYSITQIKDTQEIENAKLYIAIVEGDIFSKENNFNEAYSQYLLAEKYLKKIHGDNLETDLYGLILEKLVMAARKSGKHAYAEHYAIQHEKIFGKFNERSRRIDSLF